MLVSSIFTVEVCPQSAEGGEKCLGLGAAHLRRWRRFWPGEAWCALRETVGLERLCNFDTGPLTTARCLSLLPAGPYPENATPTSHT